MFPIQQKKGKQLLLFNQELKKKILLFLNELVLFCILLGLDYSLLGQRFCFFLKKCCPFSLYKIMKLIYLHSADKEEQMKTRFYLIFNKIFLQLSGKRM